jgi:hypothetical protein
MSWMTRWPNKLSKENNMLALNDEWLSWPPESLDQFFICQTIDEVTESTQQNESIGQLSLEKINETLSPNLND